MATDYGKRLKLARKNAKLTQAALSKKTGIAQSTISTAEREGHGSADTPVYANACGVSALWLATGESAMTSGPVLPATSARPESLLVAEPAPTYQLITIDVAIATIANHLEETEGYDKPTAIALFTTLANSPDMHAIVAAGLKTLKPQVRGDPSKQAAPAKNAPDARAA